MLHQVVNLQLASVALRLKERDIHVTMTPAALDFVVEAAFQPQYGARPLRRYLEKHVVTAIGKMMIRGEVVDHCSVAIGVREGVLDFVVAPLSPAAKRARMGC